MRNLKYFLLSVLPFLSCSLVGQYGKQRIQWVMDKPKVDTGFFSVSRNSHLIILDQRTEIKFYSSSSAKLNNYVRFLIKSEKGVEQLKNYRLPESFDPAFDLTYYKQGRASRIKTPNIFDYKITSLSTRKFSSNKWSEVKSVHSSERIRRINNYGDSPGEFYHDDEHIFLGCRTSMQVTLLICITNPNLFPRIAPTFFISAINFQRFGVNM